MNYKYASVKTNYEDLSAGRVLYSIPGSTGFPVRLASEIFQRGAAYLEKKFQKERLVLYDPCCGSGYLLTTIGLLHHDKISQIYASDIDLKMLGVAEKNLKLLTLEGIEKRIQRLQEMYTEYGKDAHKLALESAIRLYGKVKNDTRSVETNVFFYDVTGSEPFPPNILSNIDFVLTDLPYGNITHWQGSDDESTGLKTLIERTRPILSPRSVVAIVSLKKQKLSFEHQIELTSFSLGKRIVTFLVPIVESA